MRVSLLEHDSLQRSGSPIAQGPRHMRGTMRASQASLVMLYLTSASPHHTKTVECDRLKSLAMEKLHIHSLVAIESLDAWALRAFMRICASGTTSVQQRVRREDSCFPRKVFVS